jgi:hypothetical protein
VIIAFAVLYPLFSFAAFGAVFLCLKRTAAAEVSGLVAAAAWPALMVIFGSCAGYLHADRYSFAIVAAALAIGCVCSALVIVRYRTDLTAIHWPTICAAHGVAIVAGLMTLAPQIWHNDFGYFEFGNGEFLNYSQLAEFSLGHQTSTTPVLWELKHQSERDGIDFINCTVSILTGREPAHIVQFVAALMRSSYFAALLSVLLLILSRQRWAAIAIGVGAAFVSTDMYQFNLSFMGGSLGAAMVVGSVSLVAGQLLQHRGAVLLYVILNVALLVSYPEAMVALKILETVLVAEQFIRLRDRSLLFGWIAGNLATIAINPPLVLAKILHVWEITGTAAGWNFIADPISESITYLARILGIEPLYESHLALTHSVRAIKLAAAIYALACVSLAGMLCYKLKSLTPALILLSIAALHTLAYMGRLPHFYVAAKLFLSWWWTIPIAFALSYRDAPPMLRKAMVPLAVLFLIANVETFRRDVVFKAGLPEFYSATQAATVLATLHGSPARIDTTEDIPVMYWAQLLDSHRVGANLTERQQTLFSRNPMLPASAPGPAAGLMVIHPVAYLRFQLSPTDLISVVEDQRLLEPAIFEDKTVSISAPTVAAGG